MLVPVNLFLTDGMEDAPTLHQSQPAAFAALTWVSDRVLINVVPDPVSLDGRRLHGELHGISIDMLKHGAAHSEDNVLNAELSTSSSTPNFINRHMVDSVALENTQIRWKQIVAFAVGRETKFVHESSGDLRNHFSWFTGIGTSYQLGT